MCMIMHIQCLAQRGWIYLGASVCNSQLGNRPLAQVTEAPSLGLLLTPSDQPGVRLVAVKVS